MQRTNKYKLGVLSFSIAYCLLINSCTQIEIFEKNTSIPNYKWQQGFAAKGDFVIADTVSPYNIYLVLRHTDTYQYNNIWLHGSAMTQSAQLQAHYRSSST